jgi:hypothetical protein
VERIVHPRVLGIRILLMVGTNPINNLQRKDSRQQLPS